MPHAHTTLQPIDISDTKGKASVTLSVINSHGWNDTAGQRLAVDVP